MGHRVLCNVRPRLTTNDRTHDGLADAKDPPDGCVTATLAGPQRPNHSHAIIVQFVVPVSFAVLASGAALASTVPVVLTDRPDKEMRWITAQAIVRSEERRVGKECRL